MLLFKKLDRFLLTEILALTFVTTSGLSSILVVSHLPQYAEFIFSSVNRGISFLMLCLYILPTILKYALPVSVLVACTIVSLRMSMEREMEGWGACGVSMWRLSFTPALVGLSLSAVLMFSGLFLEPYSSRQFERYQILQTSSLVENFVKSRIMEKAFIEELSLVKNVKTSMYFQQVSSDKSHFNGIFISLRDKTNDYSSVIVSYHGELKRDLTKGYPDYLFSLRRGKIYSYQEEGTWTVDHFDKMEVSLVTLFKDRFREGGSLLRRQEELLYPHQYLRLLAEERQKYPNWREVKTVLIKYINFYKTFAIAGASFFLPIIGMCLGMYDTRKRQFSVYLSMGGVLLLLYGSLSLVQKKVLDFYFPLEVELVATPFLMAGVASLLLGWRVAVPPSTSFLSFLGSLFRFSQKKSS